jgi:16S rRNA (guanine966-N2)-methyltransferase
MRIIGGKYRGRRFNPPADKWPTRPTTDFAKEALFNILNNEIDFEESVCLDLFGGTGSHTYEMLSRGCTDATIVEQFGAAVQFIRQNIAALGHTQQVHLVKGDVFKFIPTCTRQFQYIFAGPPYPLANMDDIPKLIFEHNILAPDGLFVLEHDNTRSYQKHPFFCYERTYSNTIFSFFAYPRTP